jgi:hypothetical protein
VNASVAAWTAAHWVAQAEDTTTEWKHGAGNVIFLCVFVIGLMVVAAWWLRR